jgi:Siphovirus ReqiPepy6 Gp37-like protein
MDLYVFDNQFNLHGIIDSFKSLIWRREFYKTGSFELHLNLPEDFKESSDLIALVQKDRIIVKEDSPEEAAYIVGLKFDDKAEDTLVITGFLIDNFLSERLIWEETSKTGTAESVMKYFVERNAVSPELVRRKLPGLTISTNRNIEIPASETNSYGNLAEVIEGLAIKYDVGWRVLFDLANKQYIFDVFNGRDLSVNQSVNPRAIFSMEFENVLEQTYTDSNSGYKNMALVAGQGEGAARKKVLLNDELEGFERKEVFVDARDLSNVIDNTTLSDEEYEILLEQRGLTKLSECKSISTLEGSIVLTSNLVYKIDFDLGDIVTTQNERLGVTLNTRITTIEEVYENDYRDIRVNFGSNIPTLLEKIEQRMR